MTDLPLTLSRSDLAASGGREPPPAGAGQARTTQRRRLELPTLLLALGVYAAWLALTLQYGHWPLLVLAPVIAVLLTLHSSLQHEIVHGHPTGSRAVNRLLGSIPLSLWLPFERYRQTHLTHHDNARLTDPLDDPESYYWTPEDWARATPLTRAAVRAQTTLAGRVVIGSFWVIGRFLAADWQGLRRDEPGLRRTWLAHLLWCVPVLLWVHFVCGIPLAVYVGLMVIPGNGILLIRSFAEHRASPATATRTALVEHSWFLGPLFLFNNLHSLHHELPGMPWYEYRARYRECRERLIAANGGLVYDGYGDVARRFLFRAHDTPVHPLGRAPTAS